MALSNYCIFSLLLAAPFLINGASSQSCGRQSVTMRPNRVGGDGQRIVGGVEARPSSHPWIVSIQQNGKHICGGSLLRVDPNKEETDVVVTAAHCFDDGLAIAGLTVNAGAHNLKSPSKTQQTATLSKYVIHPQYNADTDVNDIAVVKLTTAVKFGPDVQPICLPSEGDKPADGTEATVAGWGVTEEDGKVPSNVLMQVRVPIVNNKTCIDNFKTDPDVVIDPVSMICAGYPNGGMDSCKGDSGGPLVTLDAKKSKYVLHGVVSYGIGCARPNQPGVYSRVTYFLPWLNGQLKTLSTVAG